MDLADPAVSGIEERRNAGVYDGSATQPVGHEAVDARLIHQRRTFMRVKNQLSTLLLTVALAANAADRSKNEPPLSDYIRPFVGTQGEGNTYPGPSEPFGMVQL